jgi:hypothetical protein
VRRCAISPRAAQASPAHNNPGGEHAEVGQAGPPKTVRIRRRSGDAGRLTHWLADVGGETAQGAGTIHGDDPGVSQSGVDVPGVVKRARHPYVRRVQRGARQMLGLYRGGYHEAVEVEASPPGSNTCRR